MDARRGGKVWWGADRGKLTINVSNVQEISESFAPELETPVPSACTRAHQRIGCENTYS